MNYSKNYKSSWDAVKVVDKIPPMNNPVLIEGLPGIGNVGKVAVDLIIDKCKVKKLYEFSTVFSPSCVFINHDTNLVYLPSISLYLKKGKKKTDRDLLLLAGDFQPSDQKICFDFCFDLSTLAKEFKVKDIITLAGMGTNEIPKEPSIYCTANSNEYVKKCIRGTKVLNDVSRLGAITGVSGVLLGVASKFKINAACFLIETFADPRYVGVKESRELVKLINFKFNAGVDLTKIDKDISNLEKESAHSDVASSLGLGSFDDSKVNYIG